MRRLFLRVFLCSITPAQQRHFSFRPISSAFHKSLGRLVISETNPKRLSTSSSLRPALARSPPPTPAPPASVRLLAQRSIRFADPNGVADQAILNIFSNSTEGIQFTREVHSVTLAIAYLVQPTLITERVIYGAARDRQGNNSGWQLIGHHNLSTAFPTNQSNSIASPPNPNSPLSIFYEDINSTTGNPSSTNIRFAQVLIQNTLDARRACYLGFDHNNNLLYLMSDEGTRLRRPSSCGRRSPNLHRKLPLANASFPYYFSMTM